MNGHDERGTDHGTEDRIDAYLDELLERLSGDAKARRRMLLETESHLRESTDHHVTAGMDEDAAQRAAIAAFGTPAQVARSSRSSSAEPAGTVFGALVSAGARLVGVGLIAVGISVLVARLVSLVTSTEWVYGAPSGLLVTGAKCVGWLADEPGAGTCSAAATLENRDDSFLFTSVAVVAGLIVVGLVLGVLAILRRRRPTRTRRVPNVTVWAIAATAFGGAGIALIAARASDLVVRDHWGQGLWYSEGVVSLAFALYFGLRLLLATSKGLVRASHADVDGARIDVK